MPPGDAAPIQFQAGNPYGTSHVSQGGDVAPGDTELETIDFQMRRSVEIATVLRPGQAE